MTPKYITPIEAFINGESKPRTSRTFKIDWENKRLLSKTIDGVDAVGQGTQVRLAVEWLDYQMMPDTFGIALKQLYNDRGDPMPRDYVLANLQRLIGECLSPDLRIHKILDFQMEERKNSVICTMTVDCEEGIFETITEIENV